MESNATRAGDFPAGRKDLYNEAAGIVAQRLAELFWKQWLTMKKAERKEDRRVITTPKSRSP